MVFQNYALWPTMTVEGNVGFPLKVQKVAKADRAERVHAALSRVNLADKAGRRPARLSGGEQQRVALARALVQEPQLLLLDHEGPLVGVVRDPRTQEVFHAVRGRGAYLNGVPLHVNARNGLAGAVVMTEWLACSPWPGMFATLERLGQAFVTTRIMGSSTLSLTGLAVGRGQGCIIGKFGAVDLLAGVLICAEAGLDVRDEANEPTMFPESGGVLVANPGLADALFEMWRPEVAADAQ